MPLTSSLSRLCVGLLAILRSSSATSGIDQASSVAIRRICSLSSPAWCWAVLPRASIPAGTTGSAARVVEIVDRLGHGFADARRALEIVERRCADLPRGSEMEQQRAFSRRADPRDLVQRAGADR